MRFSTALIGGVLWWALVAVGASAASFELDSLSFFHFEGAGRGAPIPAGSTIPLSIEQTSDGVWSVGIAAEDFAMPPIVYPSGRSVRWELSAAATGSLARADDGLHLTLTVPVNAYVDGSREGIPFTFAFSTGTESARADGIRAQRAGAAVDPSSGYVQLVAAGVNPRHAATAPGKPFYAVLSGTIHGLENALASSATPVR